MPNIDYVGHVCYKAVKDNILIYSNNHETNPIQLPHRPLQARHRRLLRHKNHQPLPQPRKPRRPSRASVVQNVRGQNMA